jgi:hypothetical protein
VWLNRITLFDLPRLTPEFAIGFDIPFWLKDIQISVYGYTGPEVDPLADKVNTIDANLTQLITAFNQHAGNTSP